jgi:hypothetical protein
MKVKVELTDTFHSSIERAFKAPILGDATKFLNGYRFQPPIIGFEEDDTWGQVDGIRYPITNGNFWLPKGRLFTDKILERNENESWKWTIYDFKIPMMFFARKAIGEWTVLEKGSNRIEVCYAYTFYSKNIIFHLGTMLFCQLQWKGMMKKAIAGIKQQAESKLPFIYER